MKKFINKILYATKMTVIAFAPLWLYSLKLLLVASITLLVMGISISCILLLAGTLVAGYYEVYLQKSFHFPVYYWGLIASLTMLITVYGSRLVSRFPLSKFLKYPEYQ